ncbi:MAG: Inner rane component of cytoplasmic domain, partial [Actinomycetota bacterium]
GSTNGTLLNGHKVTSSPLEQGDVITIGATKLVFRIVPGVTA